MLRSLKVGIELNAQDAINALEQMGYNVDTVKEELRTAQREMKATGRDSQEMGRRAQQSFQRTERSTLSMTDAIEKYRNRLLVAGAGLLAFAGFAVKAGMEVEAIHRRISAMYGEQAEQIQAWAKEQGAALGFGANTMQGYLAELMPVITGMGVAGDEATELSKRYLQMAVDMSSFLAIPMDRAVYLMTRVMRGSRTSLERYGGTLRQTTLDQAAAARGWGKSFDELDEARQPIVVLDALMTDMAGAVGYAADNLDMAQTRARRFREAARDIREELGTRLLPAFGWLTDAASGFLERIRDTGPLMDFIAITSSLGGVVLSFAGKFGMFLFMMKQIGGVKGLLSALGAPFRAISSGAQTLYIRALYARDALVSMAKTAYVRLLYLKDGMVDLGRKAVVMGRDAVRALSRSVRWLAVKAKAVAASGAAWVKAHAVKTGVWVKEKSVLVVMTAKNWAYAASVEGGFFATAKAKIATVGHTIALGAKAVALKVASAAQWALNFAMYANPAVWLVLKIAAIVAALAAVGYAIYRLVQHFGGLRVVMKAIGDWFTALWRRAQAFGRSMRLFGQQVAATFRGIWEGIVGAFQEAWRSILRFLNAGVRGFLAVVNSALGWVPWLGEKIRGAVESFDPLMPLVWQLRKSKPEIAAEVEEIANIVRNANPELRGEALLTEFSRALREARPQLAADVQEYIQPLLANLQSHSPPKAGPLRHIRDWGENLGLEYAKGVASVQAWIFGSLPSRAEPYARAQRTAAAAMDVAAPSLEVAMARLQGAIEWLPTGMSAALDRAHPITPAGLSRMEPYVTGFSGVPPLSRLEAPEMPSPGSPITLPTLTTPSPVLTLSAPPMETLREVTRHTTTVREHDRRVTEKRPPIQVTVNLGGVNIHMPQGVTRQEARQLGTETVGVVSRKMREELSRYLLEVLGAEEALRMPDEME